MMITMKYLIIALCGLVVLPAHAGDDDKRHEEWMKEAREKEMRRAQEAAKEQGDMEGMEKKYGWMKEKYGEQYQDYTKKRKAAAEEWSNVAKRISRANNYEEINALKMPAQRADAIAELSRLELRAASAEENWMKTAEKADTGSAKRVAKALAENQREIIQVTKQKMISEQRLRELSVQHDKLEQEMRGEYEKARQLERGDSKSENRRVEQRPGTSKNAKKDEPKRDEGKVPWNRPVKKETQFGPGGLIE